MNFQRDRERRFVEIALLSAVLLGVLLSCGRDRAQTVDESIRAGSFEFGEGGLPEGGPENGGGGSLLLLSEPGPLGPPQDLTDYDETAIQTWGPIASTIQVNANQPNQPVQTFNVNIIETGDPFTPTYQLPSGTIVKSSRDPEDLVFEEPDTSARPIVSWNGPNGTTDVFEGEILITFVPTADASAISSFISTHNLEVAFSWFRPDTVSGGNEIAWFQFFYDTQQYTTFAAAYNHFSQQSLAAEVDANEPFAFKRGYGGSTPGNIEPNDDHYDIHDVNYDPEVDLCRFPKEVGSAFSPLVPLGPESGGTMSNQAIAVLDDGVWREHEDLWVHSSIAPGSGLGNAGKISWVGVNIEGKDIWLGRNNPAGQWYGNPHEDREDKARGGLLSHGTKVAGAITAGTNNDPNPGGGGQPDFFAPSVAGVAPSTMVLPIRLTATENDDDEWLFTSDSVYKSINALYDYFKPWQWEQRIRVSNMSFYESKFRGSLRGFIEDDQQKYDRLYVGIAGNEGANTAQYPGAYDNVLGVTGLIRDKDYDADLWYANKPGMASNYRNDNFQTYPISGVFDFWDSENGEPWIASQSTSPDCTKPIPPEFNSTLSLFVNPDGKWEQMNGTSACAPQVAGLAALLFTMQPGSTRQQVWSHIVNTRDNSMVAGLSRPLAGVVDYEEALSTW